MQVYTDQLLTFLNGSSRVFLADNIDEYNFYKNVFKTNQYIVPVQFVVSRYGEHNCEEDDEGDSDGDSEVNSENNKDDEIWLDQLSVYNCIPIAHIDEHPNMITLEKIMSFSNDTENLPLNEIRQQFYSYYSGTYGTEKILDKPINIMNTTDEDTYTKLSVLYTLDQHLCDYDNHKKRCKKNYKVNKNDQPVVNQDSINISKLINCIELIKRHDILKIIQSLDYNNKIYYSKDSIRVSRRSYDKYNVYGYIGFLNLQD